MLVGKKILVFDIETSQMLVKVWQLRGNDYIDPGRIVNDWFVICWAAKWFDDDKMETGVLTSKEAKNRNDKRIVKKIWNLFDEADIIIAHNGDRFDIAKLKARFLKHDLKLPSPYKSVDTLKVARREFRLTSNKLDYICGFTGLTKKIETGGIALWDDSEAGDNKALKKMDEYCQNDVRILENMYIKLRPYIKNHPNIGLIDGNKIACPNCGSLNVNKRGFNTNRVSKSQRWQCLDCGSWHSSPLKENSQIR